MRFTWSVKKIFFFFPILVVLTSVDAQQFYRTELATAIQVPKNDSSVTRNFEEEKKSWKEIPEKRTLNSSSWTTPSGSIMTQYSSRAINYNKNGSLVPINPNISEDENGWAANDQPYPVRVNSDGSFELTTIDHQSMLFGAGTMINDQETEPSDVYASSNAVLFKNIIPGVDRQIDVRENGAKYSYIIPQSITTTGNYTTIVDEVWLPRGTWISIDSANGEWKGDIWYGDIVVRNLSGQENARLHRPICFDASGNVIAGGYKLERTTWDTGISPWFVTICVPNSWLTNNARSYPIVIDPLVTGPTAIWTGGVMPSCFVPAYNADSIQVTIPAQITVTGFFVTASYYADPFSTAIMADGDMYFSTTCNVTQHFTIPVANGGNLPGTAYLQAFDLRMPLTCCWPQNCAQQQFWLTMHLGRTAGGSGCNTNYVYYDPSSLWPFSAYIEGHTVEFTGAGWVVPNTPLCSDSCTITGTAYARYGVPPYTFTHPWMTGNVTGGSPAGCNFGNTTRVLSLIVPNCPLLCDTTSQISVPPCIITDGCGNVVQGLPNEVAFRKPVPVITSVPSQQTVCSNDPYSVILTSCLTGTTINWSGNNNSGTGNISGGQPNLGVSDTTINYFASGTLNGCTSDTISIAVTIDPQPIAAFTTSPSPGIAGMPLNFVDQSITGASSITSWVYNISTGDTLLTQNPTYTFTSPGIYSVCLGIVTGNGCNDSVCNSIEIIPAEIVAPNVITPNGDGINDLLEFQYLEYYPDNRLLIYDRWGALMYDQKSYQNNWDARQYSDGTYYYVLTIQNKDAMTGFFEILK